MKDTNLKNLRFNQYESNITSILSEYYLKTLFFNVMITYF